MSDKLHAKKEVVIQQYADGGLTVTIPFSDFKAVIKFLEHIQLLPKE